MSSCRVDVPFWVFCLYPIVDPGLLLLSHVSHVWLCATPQMAAQQAPPSLGFSRQEYGSGLPFPSPLHKVKSKVKSLSCVRLLATPWTVAHQAPLSMGFSRQEYRSGLPLPSLRSRSAAGKLFCKGPETKWASPMAHWVTDLPAMPKTQVWSLGPKYPLEEEPGRLHPKSCKKLCNWAQRLNM